jgi:N-acyl-L-homoserine lactone synthetase
MEYPDGREIDEYDPHSIHVAATNESNEVVSTLRLVVDSPLGFPLERFGAPLCPRFAAITRVKTAEISRLIVARGYRENLIRHPLLLWGLFAETYAESRRAGLHGLLASMEETLWRLLRRFEFHFDPIGGPFNYYGEVVPYYASLDSLEPGYQKVLAFQRRFAGSQPASFQYFAVKALCHPGPTVRRAGAACADARCAPSTLGTAGYRVVQPASQARVCAEPRRPGDAPLFLHSIEQLC